ncbi:PREDICTED: uncharacterized protein LOC109213525 isoform X1 [Nicotiana attenuata]|uniref:uncharacterized protein LOC109213525 isoform X1 n=2 Tax=Nicotiana attenuata TaxID=49451 RepID=UPI000904AF22|nr:PREDICTED: uncharacterized protein LOC109213525 isoform X1 [Nicotiana attenuata]
MFSWKVRLRSTFGRILAAPWVLFTPNAPIAAIFKNWWDAKTKNKIHGLILQAAPTLICWEIWKQRSSCRYATQRKFQLKDMKHQVIWNINSIVTKLTPNGYTQHHWPSLCSRIERLKPVQTWRQVQWHPPLHGKVKVNTDGSSMSVDCDSHNMAEALAAEFGEKWCDQLGFTNFVLELDSNVIVNMVNQEGNKSMKLKWWWIELQDWSNMQMQRSNTVIEKMGNRNLVFTASWRDLLLWKRTIGAVNGVLVLGIVASFTALVAVASGDLHWEALLKANFEAAPQSIPIIALSFVYQNVVPVLCTNLEGDLSKVRSAIVFGTAIPLALFLVWDGVILGTITTLGTEADKIIDPLQLLRATNGIVGPIVDVFSLLAIATSYIGFVLGLVDFLADLLKLPSGPNRPLPYLLTLVPPLILSQLDPEIFFKALDFAGTYGVLVLFGLVPAAMSWSDRYWVSTQTPNLPPLVPGGKITLSLIFGGAAFFILSEIGDNFAHA